MASMAIEAAPQLLGPGKTVYRRNRKRRRRNGGRLLSKAVRDRNINAGRPWWQPSRSAKHPAPSRAAVLQAALREELDETLPAPQEIVVGYEEAAQQHLVVREREEEEIILHTAVVSGLGECSRARKLATCQAYFEAEVRFLEEDSEIGSHATAWQIENIDRQALASLAAA